MTIRALSSALALATFLGASCARDPGHGGSAGPVLAQPAESPEAFGAVGPFSLTERSGAIVTRDDLLGTPWVASFIFTRCSGPCPKVTSTMRRLQDRLKNSDARLVSFSVDPEWDTPEVLTQYARDAGADSKRWLFLTGAESSIFDLIEKSFLLSVVKAPANTAAIGMQVSHKTKLVVVDRRGRIRGFYAGDSDKDLDTIVARLRWLEREPREPGSATIDAQHASGSSAAPR